MAKRNHSTALAPVPPLTTTRRSRGLYTGDVVHGRRSRGLRPSRGPRRLSGLRNSRGLRRLRGPRFLPASHIGSPSPLHVSGFVYKLMSLPHSNSPTHSLHDGVRWPRGEVPYYVPIR